MLTVVNFRSLITADIIYNAAQMHDQHQRYENKIYAYDYLMSIINV